VAAETVIAKAELGQHAMRGGRADNLTLRLQDKRDSYYLVWLEGCRSSHNAIRNSRPWRRPNNSLHLLDMPGANPCDENVRGLINRAPDHAQPQLELLVVPWNNESKKGGS
jgi:hypothetical protein